MMDLKETRLELNNGIATVTLCRPEHMNAFTMVMVRELLEIFAEVDRDDAVAGDSHRSRQSVLRGS